MATKIGPSYRLVADDIRSRITAGQYPIGEKIPSTLQLRQQYEASDTVVRRAVADLEDAGILIGHPGKGVYVKALPADADSEQQDLQSLAKQLAELQRIVGDLAEHGAQSGPAELAGEWDKMRATVGRLEANLIDLYGKLGYDYPQDSEHDGAKATARRERSRR